MASSLLLPTIWHLLLFFSCVTILQCVPPAVTASLSFLGGMFRPKCGHRLADDWAQVLAVARHDAALDV